ncbi:MAG: bacterial transcriptional activator domain-containing protein [Acidimicrobiales bacterium]
MAAAIMLLRLRERRDRDQNQQPQAPSGAECLDQCSDPLTLCAADDHASTRWLSLALASLAARSVWDGEDVAHPLLARLSVDRLEVDFSGDDPMAAPVPWVDLGEGRRWRLMRSILPGQLPAAGVGQPLPTMVTAGDGLLVSLEGMGLLTIEGEIENSMGVVRSFIAELVGGARRGEVDIRATFAVTGIEGHGLIRRQQPVDLMTQLPEWLDHVEERLQQRSATTAYGHRVGGSEKLTSTVVITDPAGARDMPTIVEAASQQRLPLAVVIVGGHAEPGEAALVLDSVEHATLEPWGIEFVPHLRTPARGRRLAELLDGCTPRNSRRRPTRATAVPTQRSKVGERRRNHSHRGRPRRLAVAVGPESTDWPLGPDLRRRMPELPERVTPIERSEPVRPPATVDRDAVAAAEVTTPEVAVLGRIEIRGIDRDLTSQQLSLLAFVACHPSATKEAVVDAIWDGQPISKSRFPNLLAETRSRIGRRHLPEASEGSYRLVGIRTDLARFERAVDAATTHDTDAERTSLRSALELVRGVPFTAPATRFWSWVGNDGHIAARVESTIADAAIRLARIEQDAGALEEARWACEKGLLASPADQTLVTILTEVYLALDKPALATRLVESWESLIARLDCGEPSDEPRRRLAESTNSREGA